MKTLIAVARVAAVLTFACSCDAARVAAPPVVAGRPDAAAVSRDQTPTQELPAERRRVTRTTIGLAALALGLL